MPAVDFQRLFEHSPNAYMLLDRELRYVAMNAAYLEATGHTREGLLGRNLFELFPHDPADPANESARRLRASFEKVLTTGQPDVLALIPYRVPHADGGASTVRYWSATHTPVFNADGQVGFILQHTVDVTELEELRQAAGPAGAGVLGRARVVAEANVRLDRELVHLRRLFEQAPGFVAFLRGPRHVFELANAAYRELVGDRPLIGHSVREVFPDLEGQGFFELIDGVFASGEAYVGRGVRIVFRRTPGGAPEEAFLDFIYQPIVEADGSVSGIFVQGHDVTEQQRSAAAREQALRELHFLAESIPQQVWTATPDGTVDYVNRRFSDYFGGGDGAVLGRGWEAVPHADDLPRIHERWAHSLATGEPYEIECRLRRHDGAYRWFLGRALPFRDEGGRIVKWYGTNTDIDEAKAVREELTARAEYEEQLIGIVSHDLRSPLAAINLSAELLLRRGELVPRQAQALSRILAASDRATRLIADMLDFTRTRFAGKLPVAPAEVNVRALVREVVEELQLASPDRLVRVTHAGEETGWWDRDRLAQAVGNLVGNALQHGPAGAPVTVQSETAGDTTVIRVHNEGLPIAAADLPRLFLPFQRGTRSAPNPARSVGLGLYIAREIARAHGGEIEVRSVEGEGTTFAIRLPRGAGAS